MISSVNYGENFCNFSKHMDRFCKTKYTTFSGNYEDNFSNLFSTQGQTCQHTKILNIWTIFLEKKKKVYRPFL